MITDEVVPTEGEIVVVRHVSLRHTLEPLWEEIWIRATVVGKQGAGFDVAFSNGERMTLFADQRVPWRKAE
ncbi:MAG: hypothetical protein C5B60_10245 [Chloroflexi bacterium]|nr:MAG: hypothetical protein C5B60_10245 [Chloroflexota bacterium]